VRSILDRAVRKELRSLAIVVAAACLVLFAIVATGRSAAHGVRVSMISSPAYGKVLVVGSGQLSGFPLYEFSGDVGSTLRCGTARARGSDVGVVADVVMSCTGPMSDLSNSVTSDDWPALTSSAPPVAGRGVDQALLGTVGRPGIGSQVTYGGHPLYLFDPPSSPFAPQGVGYVETAHPLAPWHGIWYLVSAARGAPVAGPARVAVGRLPDGAATLTVEVDGNVYPLEFAVYEFSLDSPTRVACTGTCNLAWIPVLTTGKPRAGPGVRVGELGRVALADGTSQVTYDGHPLYLYARERVTVVGHDRLERSGTEGNGEGGRWGRGRFALVAPSA
jgi:predicted lipoprotein with Yx(FWY)xxD motif